MASPHCASVLDNYLASMPDRYAVHREADGCRFVTPFYLPDNTQLTVSIVERPDGSVEVTDFGETVDHLFLSGLTLRSDDRRLVTISRRFGVEIDGGEITKVVDSSSVSRAIDDVVHAVLDVSYLVYTRTARKAPTFTADVEQFLMYSDVPYERGYEVLGYADEHRFDYHIPARQTPLLLEALSASDQRSARDQAQAIAFKVLDVGKVSEPGTFRFVCLLDDRLPDQQEALTPRSRATLAKYLDDVILWSERQKIRTLLVA